MCNLLIFQLPHFHPMKDTICTKYMRYKCKHSRYTHGNAFQWSLIVMTDSFQYLMSRQLYRIFNLRIKDSRLFSSLSSEAAFHTGQGSGKCFLFILFSSCLWWTSLLYHALPIDMDQANIYIHTHTQSEHCKYEILSHIYPSCLSEEV